MPVDFSREAYCILGLPFDAVDTASAARRIREAVRERRRCVVNTPNTNILVSCLRDAGLRDAFIQSDLSVADGMPLVLIAKLLQVPLPGRVSGSSVFQRLREEAGPPLGVYFFGGDAGVAEAACAKLNAEERGLTCVGFASPGFGSVAEMSSDEVIGRINASEADFVFVAIGARKGQAWIEGNRSRLSAAVICYLGATINFVAGRIARAPSWMQRAGLEWLWRIKEEPALWRRYFFDGLELLRLFATRVLPYAWLVHRRRHSPVEADSAAMSVKEERGETILSLRGPWARENLAPLRERLSAAAGAGANVRIDLAETSYVDASFLGLALLAYATWRSSGARLAFTSAGGTVRRIFQLGCCEFLLSDASRAEATAHRTVAHLDVAARHGGASSNERREGMP